ncbi:MAG: GNAT family N-acetyltransferase [Chloroflexi bacterium]|nr:GNAT family N-acetyltransferase [Chloroflexota bacterium]MDE2637892.1 GNAT family N-acetyltransferase [Chloroflexota bacterium]
MTDFDFATIPILETDRLLLRRVTVDDYDDWLAVWHSPGVLDYLIDFDGAPDGVVAKAIIEWADRIIRERSGIRWAITLKPHDRMIGSCGFHLYARRDRRVEIGYELHSDFWRQGIMSEAAQAVVNFCFVQLDVHRVEADVVEGNVASAALLKTLGFSLEGNWRDRVFKRGAYHSLWQFGLLAPDYLALRKVKRAR